MEKVTVLGAAGAVGSVASTYIAHSGAFSDILLADANENKVNALAKRLGKHVSAAKVDARDTTGIQKVIAGSDVVLNCVGPFFRYGPTVLAAAAAAKINYVDVCDDMDATQNLLGMDDAIKAAGINALIGMGNSPGAANVLARFAAEVLLDECDSVDIYHAHGGEPNEGRAVIAHRLHSMVIDIPVFLDGRMQSVRLFEESGRGIEENTEFKNVGTCPVYGYPHPETITLPKHIKGIKRVTNRGLVLPVEYAELIKSVVRAGIVGEEPIDHLGKPVVPFEFAITYILSKRDEILERTGLKGARGCLKIVAKGRKGGEETTYAFQISSAGQGMGEGTGIPAAAGTVLMATGKISGTGVQPPEACVQPLDFFAVVKDLLAKAPLAGGGGLPLSIDKMAGGKTENIDVSAFFG